MEQGGGSQGGRPATASPRPRTSPRVAAAAAAPAAVRPWGDVFDNVLVTVSRFLRCRADRAQMACVNKHWHAAVTRQPPPPLPPLPALPPQLPWLIFPNTETPTFYSALTGRHHRCRLPPNARRGRLCGSGDGGWLILALNSSHAHALYNPNTGHSVPLPPGFTSQSDNEYPLVVRAATLSAAPSPNPYMVAAIVLVRSRSTAAFWSEGSDSWFTSGGFLTVRPQDVVYFEGAFYFLTIREGVISFRPGYGPNGSVNIHRVEYEVQKREDYDNDVAFVQGNGAVRRYLVVSRGRLLMVVRFVYDEMGTEMFRVFRFRVTVPFLRKPLAIWEHVGDQLDGRMLFLGPGCSRSFEVAQYDGFQDHESMIFYLDESFDSVPSADGRRLYSFIDMGRYSMVDMTSVAWPPGDHPTRSDNAPPTWWLH
ncbi:hypothetical protein EJB05_16079, partial [Eragrostis curvula]